MMRAGAARVIVGLLVASAHASETASTVSPPALPPFPPATPPCTRSTCSPGPNFRADGSFQAQAIREHVFGRAGFSKIIAPTSNRAATLEGDEVESVITDVGTDVRLQIRFFKVQSIKAAEGWMQLKVWYRMRWTDTRLAWNASAFGGVTTTFYQATAYSGGEENEVWVPDIQPYNAVSGIVDTLEPSLLRVSSDGSVFWSRPGSLDVMCKFSGLVAFPQDKLKCAMEIGGWALSGGYQGLQLEPGATPGYEFSQQESTSGSSYQEYSIHSVAVRRTNYQYDCCPSEPWPVVVYSFTLDRAAFFYQWVVILPGIVITLLSFAVFWADTDSADALGYGISVIVVNLLGNIILIEMLPVCGELIWVDLFSYMNTAFCCLALLQSAINIMLENYDGDYLFPVPLVLLFQYLARYAKAVAMMDEVDDPARLFANASTIRESVAGVLYRSSHSPSASWTFLRNSFAASSKESSLESPSRSPPPLAAHTSATDVPESERPKSMAADTAVNPAEKAKRLIFFERLFFLLDEDSSLFVERDECESLLSYASLDLDPLERERIMEENDKNRDMRLNRVEFVRMCANHLWNVEIPTLEMAVDNMRKARNARVTRNRARWRRIADENDKQARIVIPCLYFFALVWMFNVELTDRYSEAGVEMFQGLGPWHMPPKGVAMLWAYVLVVLSIGGLWWYISRVAAQTQAAEELAIKKSGSQAIHRATLAAKPADFGPSDAAAPASPTNLFDRMASFGRAAPSSTACRA